MPRVGTVRQEGRQPRPRPQTAGQRRGGVFHHAPLLRNRFVRSYLSGFPDDQWNDRVKVSPVSARSRRARGAPLRL